jgi:nitrate/nitrite transport system ATP-binding protein
MAYLEAAGIAKSFGAAGRARRVLRDLDFSMARGEFVSIVGAMGSGKSTLLGILAGLTPPDAGHVTIGGEPVHGIRRDAAFVFQNYSLLPWLTAIENVRLGIGAAFPALSRRAQLDEARRALEQVGLGHAIQRRPGQLSGGMRQRVSIARAFATRPDIVFLDEPFGALDALTRETLQQDLARLCASPDRPVTAILITNSLEEAILLSDRIVPMLPGPPATLGDAIAVALPRPRTAALLAHDERAARVRAHVVATLTSSVRSRRAEPAAAASSAAAAPEPAR